MNGRERILNGLRGIETDRVPVMLHSFMLAAREGGITMRQFHESPQQAARCFIESAERYDCDAVIVDLDTATLAGAVGVPVDFPEDFPARCSGPSLETLEEVNDLEPCDISRYWEVQACLETTRLLKKHFGDEICVRGNCDQAPFNLACMMRSPAAWMLDLADEDSHELVFRLLDYCNLVTTQFIRLMKETGCHLVSNGDSFAGPEMISPRLYRMFALPYEKRVIACAHELGLPHVLHICGKTGLILEDMIATGADGLEIDYKTDMRFAHDTLKGRAAFIGNIDPSGVLALGNPTLVAEKTTELLRLFSDTPRFILNSGCALPATTPKENLRTMIDVAQGFRRGSAGAA